jgi:hypothetical protein
LNHVEDSNKHIIEEIVRQVGYLQELYEDARSEEYKKDIRVISFTPVRTVRPCLPQFSWISQMLITITGIAELFGTSRFLYRAL